MSIAMIDTSTIPGEGQRIPVVREQVLIPIRGDFLPGELVVPAQATGLAIVIVGCGCICETPRITVAATALQASRTATLTLTLTLLTEGEALKDGQAGYWSEDFDLLAFNFDLLTHRLLVVTNWLLQNPRTRDFGIGYFGGSTFTAPALMAASQLGCVVQAVVCRSGRPDFAGNSLARVQAPTLLIVGERDGTVLAVNRSALDELGGRKRLSIIPNASHLFSEPGAMEEVGQLAAEWFKSHLQVH